MLPSSGVVVDLGLRTGPARVAWFNTTSGELIHEVLKLAHDVHVPDFIGDIFAIITRLIPAGSSL